MKKFLLGICLCVLSTGAAFAAMSDGKFLELCKNGSPEQIQAALRAGANVNARGKDKNKEGWTPLHWAANRNSNPRVIDVLVNSGANVNARNKYQGTPLMWAASDNINPEILRTLIARGADVNAKSMVGLTALMLAAQNNPNPKIIETLIDYGADVNARDKDGNRAFNHARNNKRIANTNAYQRLKGSFSPPAIPDDTYYADDAYIIEGARIYAEPNKNAKILLRLPNGGVSLAFYDTELKNQGITWVRVEVYKTTDRQGNPIGKICDGWIDVDYLTPGD